MEKSLRQILSTVLDENGFVLPLRVVAVAANGYILCVEYTASPSGCGLDVCEVAARDVAPGLVVPINILIVDAEGDAARVVLSGTGDVSFMN